MRVQVYVSEDAGNKGLVDAAKGFAHGAKDVGYVLGVGTDNGCASCS